MKKILWIMSLDKNGYLSPAVIWWYGILENMGYEVVYYDYNEYRGNIDSLYEDIKNYKPDFTIVAAYNLIHTEFIRLRDITKLYVLQSDDRWRYSNFSKFWIPFVDGVITFEGELENYVSDGLKPEQFNKMRWSFNPTMMTLDSHFNIQNGYKYFISHTGGMHGNRQLVIEDFRKNNLNVFVDQSLDYTTTKDIWSSSKYSLCITNNSLNTGKELKGRVVEIPNFCVLLTEPFPDMEKYYDMENECILFNSTEEAVEKINILEKDNNLYRKIFTSGKRRLWNSNTAYHEWDSILPNIDPDYKKIDIIKLLKEKHGDYYYA